jgi:cell division protein FtsB
MTYARGELVMTSFVLCSVGDDMAETNSALKKQLQDFTQNTQQALEQERARLLSDNAMLKQEVSELQDYFDSHLLR